MGQKTNPIGNRLGIIRGWESNWYGGNDYGDKLAEDDKIRKYVYARLAKASVSRVIIERTLKLITITITTAAMRMNAEGIKIQISGRLNGAEMARSESYKDGRIPLSTFRADIDYALGEADTTYGRLGIKVWIMKGEVYGKRELSPLVGLSTGNKGGKNDGGKRQQRRRK